MRTTLPSTDPRAVVIGLARTAWLAAVLAGLLNGCATGPKPGPGAPPRSAPPPGRDGADPNPPKELAQVPDAEPRLEQLRVGGPNKPYEVLGRQYVPATQDRAFTERGLASWYGRKFHGRPTASGEMYDMYAMTAAHPTMPLPSYARVRNPANGREVVVRINDRGPFHPGRIIDLSYTAALKLDLLRGVAPVELERITQESIRTGAWRRDATAAGTGVARSTPVNPDWAVANAAAATPEPRAAPAGAPSLPIEAGSLQAAPVAVPVPVPDAISVAPVATASGGASSTFASAPPSPSASASPSIAADGDSTPAMASADSLVLPSTPRGPGFWIQLGAFRQREGAEGFQRRVAAELEWLIERLAVFNDVSLFRLQAGPYASRDEARNAAERIRSALQLVPVVLERR